MDTLDLRDIADEWQEKIDEMSGSVPDTEGMSWGEVADATEKFLAQPEQVEYVAQYVALCAEFGLEPADPDTLRWHANQVDPTLIAESDFEEYAEQLAEDIGAINSDAAWPVRCIDWEQAASELAMDYSSIKYDGTDYYYRGG